MSDVQFTYNRTIYCVQDITNRKIVPGAKAIDREMLKGSCDLPKGSSRRGRLDDTFGCRACICAESVLSPARAAERIDNRLAFAIPSICKCQSPAADQISRWNLHSGADLRQPEDKTTSEEGQFNELERLQVHSLPAGAPPTSCHRPPKCFSCNNWKVAKFVMSENIGRAQQLAT